jgi:hypothetical protein
MRKAILFPSLAALFLFLSGCGSQSSLTSPNNTTPPASQTTPVGVTMTDTPPAGVTVLFFQLSITGATLTNSDSSVAPSSLLSSTTPVPVNVSQLQTDTAFLGNQNVAAGTYSGLTLTVANPQLTIFNASNSSSSITSICAVGKVCTFAPTGGATTLSFTTSPFPITLNANTPVAFLLDFHLDTIIQSDLSLSFSAKNAVTVSQVRPAQPHTPIGKFTGTVGTPATNSFPLQTLEGRSFTIDVDSSTTYSDFPSSACTTQGFACLAKGQTVDVTVALQADGSLLATLVKFVQLPTQQTVVGNIVGLSQSGGNTIMDLIIQLQPNPANAVLLPVGRHASITVPNTAAVMFSVDSDGFTLPDGLTFASASDLQVGQEVKVVVSGNVTQETATSTVMEPNAPVLAGPSWVAFTAQSITLEPSQITGTVASAPAQGSFNFTLATMPGYFVPPVAAAGGTPGFAIVIISVDTTMATTFAGTTPSGTLTGLTGLQVNDVISLHGWVFATASPTKITLAADKIVGRGATPLF